MEEPSQDLPEIKVIEAKSTCIGYIEVVNGSTAEGLIYDSESKTLQPVSLSKEDFDHDEWEILADEGQVFCEEEYEHPQTGAIYHAKFMVPSVITDSQATFLNFVYRHF